MRENKPSLGHPLGKSKGFGFVSFKNHDEAINCLRKVNNNPKVFGKNNVSIRIGALSSSKNAHHFFYSTETHRVI